MAVKLKAGGKIVIGLLVFGALAFGYLKFKDQILPEGKGASNSESSSEPGECVRVGVVTWGGYAGGQYMNGGFGPGKDSRLQKEFGVCAEFVVIDDMAQSREAWKAGKVDLLWATVDALPTEVAGFAEFEPIVLFQTDWSRGGDAIVVRRGIQSTADLKGKTISVAEMSPSHSFLLWMLDAAGLSINDVKLDKVSSAIDAAAHFKAGQVDAAVVWSPDDADCVASVNGSKILTNTRQATHIIADVLLAKKAYLDQNRDKLGRLVKGWLTGNGELNASAPKRAEAAKILAKGYNQPEDFCASAINNVRLTTFGDNMAFYGLDQTYRGIKGEELYNRMTGVYQGLGYAPNKVPNWRVITDPTIFGGVSPAGPEHLAEQVATFEKATVAEAKAEAIASKPVSISFLSGSALLDENAKYIVDDKLVALAKAFPTSRIRVEGNTDVVGSRASNVKLSQARAQALADYLSKEHGFDIDRFVVIGNGPDKPVCSESSPECMAKNRRTEFQILE